MERFAWLLPLLPWLAAVWIVWQRGEVGERWTALAATFGVGLSLVLLVVLDVRAWLGGAAGQVVVGPWLSSGDYQVLLSFTLDRLGLAMATLVALIALLTVRFSIHYLHREVGYHRFFAVLCLFAGGMLLLVTAGNAVLLLVGWEVAGVSSYLLIGYAYDRSTATGNAVRAFVSNRFGEAGLVAGIAFSFVLLGGIEWPALSAGAVRAGDLATGLAVGGFVLAALAKSGQVPFVAWLGGALEGPTPSSAVFYGSLMVHAGVYLLLRLEPVLRCSPPVLLVLLVLGGLTVLYGVVTGLVQSDVKSALICSTQAQVGVMLVGCGLGWFEAAAWYLALHASWRAFQFLSAPAYMHLAAGATRPVPTWLQRWQWLQVAAVQRFWFDPLAAALLVRPTVGLARDLQTFDDRVVNRLLGQRQEGEWAGSLGERADGGIVQGWGAPGRLLAKVADTLYWFEERLVRSSGGEGLLRGLQLLGGYVALIDQRLGQPRYLILIIVLTFVVIL